MEETISLKEIFETLKKRMGIIALITFVAVVTSGVVSYFFLTPIYQNSTQLLINKSTNDNNPYNVNDVRTNLELINTYNVIIKSPAILDKVIEEGEFNLTTSQLNSRISVGSEKQSQVVNVSVKDEDPVRATEIANTIAKVFQHEIADIMNVDNVSILAKADVKNAQSPIKPQPLLNIAIAFVVGLMASVGLAFLLEYLDNTIKTEQDIERILELPILGSVTTIDLDKEAIPGTNRSSSARIGREKIEA